jgi:hypothetical protein
MYSNTNIITGEQQRIAHICFNRPLLNDLEVYPEYAAKMLKVTQVNLTNNVSNFVFLSDFAEASFKYVLNLAHSMNFELACIWYEGSWPLSTEFDEQLLDRYDNKWGDDWLTAGHILAHPDSIPSFHTQCVVINLKQWTNVQNNPVNWTGYPAFKMSDEHIHDNYTPMYLEPQAGINPDLDFEFDTNLEQSVIMLSLRHGLKVHNFDHDLRYHKHCCYPEDDVEETMEWLLDTEFLNRDQFELANMLDTVPEDKQELFGLKIANSAVMYVTNTEAVPGDQEYPVNKMFVPCSGLHQFKHIINALPKLEKVIWYDFSPGGVFWTQHVIKNWDGNDFDKFYQENFSQLKDRFVSYHCHNYNPDKVREFEQHFDDQEWHEYWKQIQDLDHEFINLDIVKQWNQITDMIDSDDDVLVQITNIWQYEVNYLNSHWHDTQLSYVEFMNTLCKKSRNCYIQGDSPGGKHYTFQNLKTLATLF